MERLGVRVQTGVELGATLGLDDLRSRFDAVFLGLGLGATPAMGIPGEERIVDGLEYIEAKQVERRRHDCGTQRRGHRRGQYRHRLRHDRQGGSARRRVTMVYRRTEREMTAYRARVRVHSGEKVSSSASSPNPCAWWSKTARVTGLGCVDELGDRTPAPRPIPDSEFVIRRRPDRQGHWPREALAGADARASRLERGYIQVNADFETSIPGVFAGGDCIRIQERASTVMAVQDGKLAASGDPSPGDQQGG